MPMIDDVLFMSSLRQLRSRGAVLPKWLKLFVDIFVYIGRSKQNRIENIAQINKWVLFLEPPNFETNRCSFNYARI